MQVKGTELKFGLNNKKERKEKKIIRKIGLAVHVAVWYYYWTNSQWLTCVDWLIASAAAVFDWYITGLTDSDLHVLIDWLPQQ